MCFPFLNSHYFPFFIFSFSIFLVPSSWGPALFNGLLCSWPHCISQTTLCTLLTGTSPRQGNSSPSELFIPTHAHSPAIALITGWVCHLHWAQVLLPDRLSEIESPSHLPRRAEGKGLHRCQGLCSKTSQLLQGEPQPAHKSEITFLLAYDIPRNEANIGMKRFVGFILSFQSSFWSALNISLEVQQKVSYYFSIFNAPFCIVASVFSIILYHTYSFLLLKI